MLLNKDFEPKSSCNLYLYHLDIEVGYPLSKKTQEPKYEEI
jgi:hypothetical protein